MSINYSTAKELIEFIGDRNEVYSFKYGHMNNDSRVYDITLMPENTNEYDEMAIYVKKTRANLIPTRINLKGEELALFKKYLKDTKIWIGTEFQALEVFHKTKHHTLKKIADEETDKINRTIEALNDSAKFYETFYPTLLHPEYIIFRADYPNNFDPFNGEQMKVYGPYIRGANIIVEKFYKLENECVEKLLKIGTPKECIEIERTENSSTVHDNDIYFYIYKTKPSE